MREVTYFIGLDDTDNRESIGTGAFARELLIYLARRLDIEHRGITRHQFLIHPDIPYTSHNSSACIEVLSPAPLEAVASNCREFLGLLVHPEADPGLCICTRNHLRDELITFGRRAQREVVAKDEALELGRLADALIEEHGGEGTGVIGALAGCALRMEGNDGRFIAHRGIRQVPAQISVGELIEKTAVEWVVDRDRCRIDSSTSIVTNNWVRPNLVDGRIVLHVNRNPNTGTLEVEKKKGRQAF